MEREVLSFIVSLFPPIVWAWFYVFMKKGRKWLVPFKAIGSAFIRGIVAGGIAVAVQLALVKISSGMKGGLFELFFSSPENLLTNIPVLVFTSALSSYFAALVDAKLLDYFLKSEITKRKNVTKSMHGVQMGIFLGFGFGAVKNIFFITQMIPRYSVQETIFFVCVSGLSYTFFASVLGYFLSLAKFHKLYQKQFFQNAFRSAFLLCGLLQINYFLFGQVFYFTVWVLIVGLGILFKYLIARRDFESKLIERGEVTPPLFYEKREIITFLVNENLSFYEMKQLAFCPNCFIIKEEGWHTCPYCGTKL